MDLNARVDINFAKVDVNFQMVSVIFFTLISVNTKVALIPHTKFQPNIPGHFGEID